MPDLLARWRGSRRSGRRSDPGTPVSQPIATLRVVAAELADSEEKIDEALGRGRLPERLLRTNAWDRDRARLHATAGMERLCADVEAAYAEVRRIRLARAGRMWQAYLAEPEDRVQDALARIRTALDALEVTIEALSTQGRPAAP